MTIKTKYEIGQKVWIVYKNKGEVCIFDEYIEEICINNDGLYYMLKEACIDIAEEDIVLYEETDKLVEKIKQTMKDVREKESEEKV